MRSKATLAGIIAAGLTTASCTHLREPVKPDFCVGEQTGADQTQKISPAELYRCAEHFYERARLSELLRDRFEVQRYCQQALENLALISAEQRPAEYDSLEEGIISLKADAGVGKKYRTN